MIQTHRLLDCEWFGMWCEVRQDKVFLSLFIHTREIRYGERGAIALNMGCA